MAEGSSSARASILRSALLFSPFLAVSAFALALIIGDVVNGEAGVGHGVGVFLVGLMTLLLVYQVVQSIRDLFSRCVETVGVVERQWSRKEFMLFRNGYIFIGRNVFRLEMEEYVDIKQGDTVRVVHYPHTLTVDTVEVVERAKPS